MKKLFLILLTLFFAPQLQAAVSSGSAAPDFTLADSQGKSHSLSDYKGKVVVLEWINHDCPFVKKHYDSGNMQGLQTEFTGKDVVWFSIASSAPGKQGHYSAEEWEALSARKSAKPTAVLLDADGKVGRLYGAQTTPHMYVVNEAGVLVYQGAIDSIPSTSKKDVPKAQNYVSEALSSLLDGNDPSVGSTKAYGCSVKYA